MSSDDAEARRFIGEHITSVAQLELLLLLRTTPEEWWSTEALARELRMDASWMEGTLRGLHAKGLCARTSDEPARYQFAPATPALEHAVTAVARAYILHRVSIIESIYSKPSAGIRVFADAFKLKRDPPHG
jgi:hypothetical protein